ncbi:UBX domain-containing protein 4 [Folsomia candida]|uniref:UBX domain-containing protein 4 n=2 Tax=Folsomia candida TaxID=158441 RepID=A0A226EX34_FOLCA|nr:UBX domain-containing protein 4 [Folsomia candida]
MGTKRSEFSLPASQKFTSGPETPVHSQSPLRHFPLQPVLPPISLRNIYIFPETSHDKFKGPRLEMDIAFLDSLLGSLGNGAGSGAEPESSASLFERLGAAEVEAMLAEDEGLTVAQQLEKYGLEDMLDPNIQAIVSEVMAEMLPAPAPEPAPVPVPVTESVPTPAPEPLSVPEVKKKSRPQKKKREEVPVSEDDEVQVVDVKPAKKMGLPKKVVIPGEFVKRPRKLSQNTKENCENEGEGPSSSVKVWRGRGPNRSKPPPQVKSRIQLAMEEMMGLDAENEVIAPDEELIPEELAGFDHVEVYRAEQSREALWKKWAGSYRDPRPKDFKPSLKEKSFRKKAKVHEQPVSTNPLVVFRRTADGGIVDVRRVTLGNRR